VVTDSITGVALTLKKTSTAPETIAITDNTAGIKSAINTFVAGYNDYIATLNGLTAYDSSTGSSGALQGDFSARSISGQIRNAISAVSDGWFGSYGQLAEIGITSTSTGALVVDDTKLSAALETSISSVEGVLTRFASPSSGSGIQVASLTDAAVKGTYTVAVSSLATSGTLSATVPGAGFPLTVDSSTDSFVVTVDGTASGTITLANQAYANLSAIATEIQTKINADATLRAAGKAVTVSVSGNDIEFRSSTLGSSSSVALANAGTDTTIAALGLALATTVSGTDLVGTINGVAGVATGNRLTGAASSAANGLVMDISATSGGTVTVSDGVIDQLDTLLSSLLGTESPLDSRISGLTAQVDSITEDRALLERRLEVIEKRYRNQFSALDSLLNQLNSTSSFLTTQLQNLPGSGGMNKK
jgi:flagellar hook-associated protein 2